MHVVVTHHSTVLKNFLVPFTGFSFGEKYFFFNSFESVFFPFVLSYSLIKFLPGACFKQRNETKQKQKNKKHNKRNVIHDDCEVNKLWGEGRVRGETRVLLLAIQGPYELRRRRQGERQTSNRFNKKNNNSTRASRFFVHFFAVLAQLRREMIKFFTSLLENGNGKEAYHLCLNSGAVPPLQLQQKFFF